MRYSHLGIRGGLEGLSPRCSPSGCGGDASSYEVSTTKGVVNTPIALSEETPGWVRESECDLLFIREFPMGFPPRGNALALSGTSLGTHGFAGATSSSARMRVVLGRVAMSGRGYRRGRGFESCRAAPSSRRLVLDRGEAEREAATVVGEVGGIFVGARTLNRRVHPSNE